MHQPELSGLIAPGAAAHAVSGQKVGTLVLVHRFPGSTDVDEDRREDAAEVASGFLGRRRPYLPVSAVQDVPPHGVTPGLRGGDLERGGWDRSPRHPSETD